MYFTFFAIRPMLTALERTGLSTSEIVIKYISRRGSFKNMNAFYNVFSLKSKDNNTLHVKTFAKKNSFYLLACLLNGYFITLEFADAVLSFSKISFYPSLFFRFILVILIKSLLKINFLFLFSFLKIKTKLVCLQ